MVGGIHSETTVHASLSDIYLWLAKYRGGQVDASRLFPAAPTRDVSLHVGLPISAARAVICAMWLVEKPGSPTPLLAGRIRGLMNPRDASVQLRFDGTAWPSAVGGAAATKSDYVRIEGTRLARHLLELIAAASVPAGEERLTA